MASFDYFFTSASPFAYLGHSALMDMARKHDAQVAFRPVRLADVFEVSGALALAKRPPVRQSYRFLELQRLAEMRGLPINIQPKFFPVDPALADLSIIAIIESGEDPSAFMTGVFEAVWSREEDIADEANIRAFLTESGFDADRMLEFARSDRAAAIRAKNTSDAIAAGVVGAPAYVLNGEPFWGQDRIEYLDQALKSGREPYQAPKI